MVPLFRILLRQAHRSCEHGTIAVLWDYLSLPQHPRSEEDTARFRTGLQYLQDWFAHPFTHVLLNTLPLPTGPGYSNPRDYYTRGWCRFEQRVSSIAKMTSLIWDMGEYRGGDTYKLCVDEMSFSRLPPLSPDRLANEIRYGIAKGVRACSWFAPSLHRTASAPAPHREHFRLRVCD